MVVNGGPQRKISSRLPPLGPASGSRQRKISRSPISPSVTPTLEGGGQIRGAQNAMYSPIAPWMVGADKVQALK